MVKKNKSKLLSFSLLGHLKIKKNKTALIFSIILTPITPEYSFSVSSECGHGELTMNTD
jgi:hypothetical protein